MSESESDPCAYAPPPAPPGRPAFAAAAALYKQRSWSPDASRDEAWLRRKGKSKSRRSRSRSVTEEDLEDLKACLELGFGFDSPELDRRLSDTLPALGLYHAVVNKQYYDSVSKSTTSFSSPDRDSTPHSPSPHGSPLAVIASGENPQAVKTRLRQWAQVVACSVRNSST